MRKRIEFDRRKAAAAAVFAAVSLAFALAFVLLLGSYSKKVGVFEMRMSIRYERPGGTFFDLKPFGRVTARTHGLPAALILSIEDVSLNEAKSLIEKGWDVRKILRQMKWGAAGLFALFVIKLFLLGIAGGALGAMVGRRIEVKKLLAGGVIGAAAVGLLFIIIAVEYNPEAFNRLEYSGAIDEVTTFLPEIQSAFEQGIAFNDKLSRVAGDLADFYMKRDKGAAASGSGNYIRILHISDLHNNPIAAKMVCKLDSGLKLDLILDTGDITDIGMPLELRIIKSLKCLKEPHLFVTGNHDLPKSVEELSRDFGIKTLDGDMVEMKGLRITGFGSSPMFEGGKIRSSVSRGAIADMNARALKALKSEREKPDIIMVHYKEVADALAGEAPVILCGHVHSASVKHEKGSLIVNAGSAGASGVRYFIRSKKSKAKYEVALITYRKTSARPVPLYADLIRFNERTGAFSLRRYPFAEKAKKLK